MKNMSLLHGFGKRKLESKCGQRMSQLGMMMMLGVRKPSRNELRS